MKKGNFTKKHHFILLIILIIFAILGTACSSNSQPSDENLLKLDNPYSEDELLEVDKKLYKHIYVVDTLNKDALIGNIYKYLTGDNAIPEAAPLFLTNLKDISLLLSKVNEELLESCDSTNNEYVLSIIDFSTNSSLICDNLTNYANTLDEKYLSEAEVLVGRIDSLFDRVLNERIRLFKSHGFDEIPDFNEYDIDTQIN